MLKLGDKQEAILSRETGSMGIWENGHMGEYLKENEVTISLERILQIL